MYDFVIVGGGVVGLSLAWELAQCGPRVCVVDRQERRPTSWVGAGILPPPQHDARHDPLEQLRTHAHRLHREWSGRLLQLTGIDNELNTCGGIYLSRSPGEAAALRGAMAQLEDDGVVVESLTAAELTRLEPHLAHLADDVHAVFHLPDEMQLRSPKHLSALRVACEQSGVAFFSGEATSLDVTDARVTIHCGERSVEGREAVLCGGTWSGQLLASLGVHLPIEPWRGQLILWHLPAAPFERVINEGHRYVVPRSDGWLLAGATVEDVGFDRSTTSAAQSQLEEFACSLLPDLRNHQVQCIEAGLRPGTPDGRPYLGRLAGAPNMAIATGHFRSGLHLSPATAVFMRQLLLDDTSEFDLSAFRIAR